MEYEGLTREEMIDIVRSLANKLDSMRKANEELVRQIRSRDGDVVKLRRELEERIAERITADDRMNRENRRFETLVANLPGAVYRCANDEAWTMEFISGQVEQLCGYPAEEFIRNNVRTYKSIIHHDDVIKVVEAVNEGVENNRPYIIEYRIRHRDGSIRNVYERGAGVFAEDGTLLWLDGVIFDVTTPNLGGMR